MAQRGVTPKYIASTATVRMAREQVRSLYGRDLAIFPPPGLSAEDSWFARTDRSSPGQLYVGYLAPGLNQQRCLAPLAAALLRAPLELFRDQRERDRLLDAWWTLVVYHGSLQGVGNSHNAFSTDIRDFARRFDQEAKEVEGAKAKTVEGEIEAEGDVEAERVGAQVQEQLPAESAGAALRQSIVQLTSRSTAQKNAEAFDRLEISHGEAQCVDAALATNMFSVGVDIARLATMVINGQPMTTAEYIQASSRVGRSEVPGLVFANYYRHQARSLSHYENFRPYHESFYRFVEPTSVTPFTCQVRTRALHAALVVALRHGCDGFSGDKDASKFDKNKSEVRALIDRLMERYKAASSSNRETEATEKHLRNLVKKWHDEAVRCAGDRRQLKYKSSDNSADALLRQFDDPPSKGLWTTLNSMRNVEDTGLLRDG